MNFKIKNITLLNTISSLILQFMTIISGFIIPRIILHTFGSSVNGLVSSFNQFLGYISLFEGGLTGVVMANLYKPLAEKNVEKISSIIKTTQNFYRKLSIVFVIYTVILAFLYPIIFNVDFSYSYVCTLGLILGIGLFIQYNFSLSYRILLNADKKVYVVSFTQVFIIIINILSFSIFVKIIPNIHFLKFISGLVFIIQPLIYNRIVNKYFSLNKNAKQDMQLLKNRWAGFAISVAAFIHNNTDVVVLTFFTNLNIVSIYSVHSLVTKGLSQLIKAMSSAIAPTIGNLYAQNDISELNKKFDLYEFFILFITFFLFSIGGMLITPFVHIYTNNINDANYYQPLFAFILILAEAIFCIKEPFMHLAYSANKFKELKIPAYIEAFLNIMISILLVKRFGLVGIAIGTLIAMLYRTMYQIMFTKKIIDRKILKFVKRLLYFVVFSGLCIFICCKFTMVDKYTLSGWIICASMYCIVFLMGYTIMAYFLFKNEYIYFTGKIKELSNRIKLG